MIIFLFPLLIFSNPIFAQKPDIFNFEEYNYTNLLHIHSYRPVSSNGIAVILVPGGYYYPDYYLFPPKDHPDHTPFINNLTDRGYIVLMPYSTDFQSLNDWKFFLDFVIDITTTNPRIGKTIFVAHSAGGMVTFSYFTDRTQPKINNVLFFNSPIVYFGRPWYCEFKNCSKIGTKSTFIFGKNDYVIMNQYGNCPTTFYQQDAINDCKLQNNPKINITIFYPGYGHSPFGENTENISLPIFLETQKIENNCNNGVDDDGDGLIDLYDKQDCCDSDRTATHDSVCHFKCDASSECDGRSPGTSWCDGYIKKTCSSTCTFSQVDCRSYGSNYYCAGGGCYQLGGGCPTLFVYDGKDYEKIRKSNIHSQKGVDTVDDIVLNNKPAVIDGNYLLSLKETTLPEHSYIDTVKLFAVDSEGMKEIKLISARHSRYGDVTSILEKSDDTRTDTKVFDNIELKFAALELKEDSYFIFEIEGYNPAEILGQWRNFPVKLEIADVGLIAVIAAVGMIVLIFVILKFFAKNK
jgi:hypothetical protein